MTAGNWRDKMEKTRKIFGIVTKVVHISLIQSIEVISTKTNKIPSYFIRDAGFSRYARARMKRID